MKSECFSFGEKILQYLTKFKQRVKRERENLKKAFTCTRASGRDSKTIRSTPKGDDVFSKISPSES